MPIKTSSHDEMPVLNLTAMIDILFLLIIFLMLGAKFAEDERKIAVDVPRVSASHGPATSAAKRIVVVDRAGVVTLDDESVMLAELTSRLSAEKGKRVAVLLRGDAGAPFQLVAGALSACKEAGVGELSVSVKSGGPVRK